MVPGSLPSGPLLQIGRARLAAIERPYTVLLSAPAQVGSRLPRRSCIGRDVLSVAFVAKAPRQTAKIGRERM